MKARWSIIEPATGDHPDLIMASEGETLIVQSDVPDFGFDYVVYPLSHPRRIFRVKAGEIKGFHEDSPRYDIGQYVTPVDRLWNSKTGGIFAKTGDRLRVYGFIPHPVAESWMYMLEFDDPTPPYRRIVAMHREVKSVVEPTEGA